MPQHLINDTLQSFVYLRVTTGPTPNLQQALVNATVDLYELDNPAPAGDDVVIPATGETEKITQKFDITEVREYQPSADQLLGTSITNENGLATFIALTNSSGGTLRDTKTTRDIHTDQVISTHTVTSLVPEKKPDYGVTITASDGAVIAQRMLIARNAPGNQLGTADNPFPVHILTTSVVTESDPSVLVAMPVTNARAWASGLAPNHAGSWNYITEIYEPGDSHPPQWVVVDVESGVTNRFDGVHGVYANDNMHISIQLRAANGCIFFPCVKNRIAYYKPADEQIYQMPQIEPPDQAIDAIIYKAVFGPDGKIYGATECSRSPFLPLVFQLDPDTLTIRVLGRVGGQRPSYSYGYYVSADPPWVYVAVGERPWDLVALNIDTGTMTILTTLRGLAPWINLSHDDKAVIATLITDQGLPTVMTHKVYLVDGATKPYPYDGTFIPRVVTPYSNKIVNPVDIDDGDGAGHLSWRPYQSQGAWTKIQYPVTNPVPIPIESLAALPDGTLIGDAREYNGFWRFNPTVNNRLRTTWNGVRSGIVSRPQLKVSDGLLYIAGYPNGVLFSYDWTKPWGWVNPQDHTDHNPKNLGEFHIKSKMKYAECLISGSNGRLYCAGHRERDGHGTGLGFYHKARHQFVGQFTEPPEVLNFLLPRGLIEIGGQIVFSGKVMPDPGDRNPPPTTAQLLMYDYDLRPISQATVKPGALDTGRLFKISDTVLMGVVNSTPVMNPPNAPDGPGSVYLFDVSTGALLNWQDFDSKLSVSTQRADGSVWLMHGRAIMRIDPVTLATRTIGTLTAPASHMAWLEDDLYLSIGPELRVIPAVSQ